jgi:hypothetical protein
MAMDKDDREIGAVGGVDLGQTGDALVRHRPALD